MGRDAMMVSAREDEEAAIFDRGVDERNPDGDDQAGVAVRGEVAGILVPGNLAADVGGQLGADSIDAAAYDFGPDEALHDVEEARMRDEIEHGATGVAAASTALDRTAEGFPGIGIVP